MMDSPPCTASRDKSGAHDIPDRLLPSQPDVSKFWRVEDGRSNYQAKQIKIREPLDQALLPPFLSAIARKRTNVRTALLCEIIEEFSEVQNCDG
jgi:hypothetical protein